MSSLSKFLNVVMVVCAAFDNGYSSDVVLEFMPNDNYFVQCSNNSKLFNSTEELSNGINSITNPNFSVDSITKNGNILTFKDVRSGNNGYYKLVLNDSTELKYKLIFDCSNEKVNFDISCHNINLLDINSKFSCVLHGLKLNKSNVILHGNDCHVVNPSIFMQTSGSNFKLLK